MTSSIYTCRGYRVPLSIIFAVWLYSPHILYAQIPTIEWQRPYGGSRNEEPSSVIKRFNQTHDGGYILPITTDSYDGDVSGYFGSDDAWIVKINKIGIIVWQKCIGTAIGTDAPLTIIETRDSGYIVAGYTASSIILDYRGGTTDAWIFNIDNQGNLRWQKCFGGTGSDIATSILQTSDGGYIFTGYTSSNDGDVVGNHLSFTDSSGSYYEDAWIVKIDSIGTLQWQYCAGGNKHEFGNSIIQTKDGGYVIAGTTSSDEEGFGRFGGKDAYIVKLTGTGEYQWQKSYGGKGQDIANSILETKEGQLIFGGTYDFLKTSDAWVMMVDSVGETLWEKKYGGSFGDVATTLIATDKGGYVFVGTTSSVDGDVIGKHGGDAFNSEDIWVVNIDSAGTLEWQKCLGGTSNDYGFSIVQTSDGSYIVNGRTFSKDGDVIGNHSDSVHRIDHWVVKLKVSATSVESGVSTTNFAYAYPNPTSEHVQFFVSKPEDIKGVELYSVMGDKYHPTYQIRDTVLSIDLRGLATGTYVARILFQGSDNTLRTQTQKIIYYSK